MPNATPELVLEPAALPSERAPSAAYRPDIDGLRTIAILSVVCFHAGVPFFNGGFVGVDIFFVISGALIGAHVYGDIRRRRFSIAEFYRRRAKRILPALFLVLAFCYLAAVILLSPSELRTFASYSVATLLSASNIFAWHQNNYFAAGADQNPLLMTWSLGVEEQFYIFFPLLMLLFARLRRRSLFLLFLAATLLSLAACIAATPNHSIGTFYLLPTRAWELAVGVLLAIYENGRPARQLYLKQRFANLVSALGVLLIGTAILRFHSGTPFPGSAAILPVAGAALLLTCPASWFNRVVLSSRPFTFIGLISYSLYLWHWPLLSFAHVLCDHPLPLRYGISLAALAFVFAWLSYRFVEQRFRNSSMPAGPLLRRYGVTSLVALLPAVFLIASHGFPARYPRLQPIEAAAQAAAEGRCFGDDAPDRAPACINTSDPRPVLAIMGDSHANAIAPALRELAAKAGYNSYEMTKASCLPLIQVPDAPQWSGERPDCAIYNDRARSFVMNDPKVRLVVLVGYWATNEIGDARVTARPPIASDHLEILHREFVATIDAYQKAGKQVILLEDVPTFTFDPLRRARNAIIPARRVLDRALFSTPATGGVAPFSEVFVQQRDETTAVIRRAAAETSAATFSPWQNLCSATGCSFMDGETLLYVDPHHVSAEGAAQALRGWQLPPVTH